MDIRYLEIVRLLIDAAPFVFTRECFALKGGTAINLFLEEMPRLSVDIDLVYTDLTHPDRDSALAAIKEALLEVAGLLKSKLQVTVRTATSGSDQESKLFISRGPILLKVEVNHVFRGTVYPVVTGRLSPQAQSHFARSLSVSMLDPDELYASKLVAVLDRQHPRDLFDVLILLESGGITTRMRRAFTVYLAGHNRPIHELLEPQLKDIRTEFASDFTGMTSRDVTLEQLLEVRERIFKDLPMALDDAERQFLLAVNRCEPDGKILGLPGIEDLPAVRWKVQNLEKLAKVNPKKYSAIITALESCLRK
jgi:predicted nucleotidyltransferase component of viral defense system